jgi:hypothetical protein
MDMCGENSGSRWLDKLETVSLHLISRLFLSAVPVIIQRSQHVRNRAACSKQIRHAAPWNMHMYDAACHKILERIPRRRRLGSGFIESQSS